MVGVFVQLKLRLMANRLRSAPWHVVVGFVLLGMMALAGSIAVARVVALAVRLLPEHRLSIAVIVYVAAALVWVLGPVVAMTVDDSLDPRTFEALPIPRTRLGIGLLAAGLIGPGGIATAVALVLGSLLAFSRSSLTAIPVVVVACTGTLLVVAIGRWVTTALSDIIQSRRSRETVAIVLALAIGAPALVIQLAGSGAIAVGDIDDLVTALRWTPPGALGAAASEFGSGNWADGTGALAVGVVGLGLVAWLSGVALSRLQTRPPSSGGSNRNVGGGRRLPVIVAGPIGAVAAKEMRYATRDARLRSQFLGAMIGIGVVGIAFGGVLADSPYAPFLGVFVSLLILLPVSGNLFGVDAGGFWTYLVAAPELPVVIRGKNLGWILVVGPIGLVACVVGGLIGGDVRYLPAAILMTATAITIWLAVGNVVSVLGAFPLPESNMFGNKSVSGAVLLWSMGGLAALGILHIPPVVALLVGGWLGEVVGATLAGIGSFLYASLVYAASWRLVCRLAESRSLVLLDALDA